MANRLINGGGGGANGTQDTDPTSYGTLTGYFYNSGGTWTVPGGVTSVRVTCDGAGGGGSNYGTGGPGGRVKGTFVVTPGEICTISCSAGGAYGAGGGTGGAVTSFTCANGTITAGGGGGAGGAITASLGSQGTNSGTVGSAGGTGNSSAAGNGGNNYIAAGATYQYKAGSTARVPSWASGTVVDLGYPSSSGGAVGAHGGEGKVTLEF